MSGGTQSPPLEGKANDPMGQAGPGKPSQDAIKDVDQRGGVFEEGKETQPSQSSGQGNLGQVNTPSPFYPVKTDEKQAIDTAKDAAHKIPGK